MSSGPKILLTVAIALGGWALTACDGGMTTPEDAGTAMMDGGGVDPDGGGGGGPDGGGGGDPDGGAGALDGAVDAGGMSGGCDSTAAAFCARFMECDPVGFLAAYESSTICRRVVAAACSVGTEIPLTNGLTDEPACEAALVRDCGGFFAASVPPIEPACVPLPGQVTDLEGACFTDEQCGTRDVMGSTRRMYCRPLRSGGVSVYGTAECPRGQCIPARAEGATCNPLNQGISEFCDRFAGQQCLRAFDPDTGTTGTNQCRTVQYGTTGAPCAPGSDRQCASGFECDPVARQCMAALNVGQACIPDRNLCDRRRALSCLDQGSGTVCVAPRLVGVGAQCGTVTVDGRTEMRMCSAYARCDTTASTPVCVALRALDETCTVDPDNCEPGLECEPSSNTCQEPEPTTSCP